MGQAILPATGFQPVKPPGKAAAARIGCPTLRLLDSKDKGAREERNKGRAAVIEPRVKGTIRSYAECKSEVVSEKRTRRRYGDHLRAHVVDGQLIRALRTGHIPPMTRRNRCVCGAAMPNRTRRQTLSVSRNQIRNQQNHEHGDEPHCFSVSVLSKRPALSERRLNQLIRLGIIRNPHVRAVPLQLAFKAQRHHA